MPSEQTPLQRIVADFAESKLALSGLAVLALILLAALFAPLISPQNPYDLAQLDERQNPSDNIEYDGASWNYRLSREVRAWREVPDRSISMRSPRLVIVQRTGNSSVSSNPSQSTSASPCHWPSGMRPSAVAMRSASASQT